MFYPAYTGAFCLLVGLLAFQSAVCADCPNGWTYYGGRCHILVQDPMTWYEARVACEVLHAHLAEVTSAEDNTFLTSLLKNAQSHSSSYAWLGLEDMAVEGQFVWITNGSAPVYQNFHHGELNSGDREDCVSLRNTGDWYDDHCHGATHFALCQRASTPSVGEEVVG